MVGGGFIDGIKGLDVNFALPFSHLHNWKFRAPKNLLKF
jgi:hypothetical protein